MGVGEDDGWVWRVSFCSSFPFLPFPLVLPSPVLFVCIDSSFFRGLSPSVPAVGVNSATIDDDTSNILSFIGFDFQSRTNASTAFNSDEQKIWPNVVTKG
uniref:Uncharacterized protein n=1 Tax=Globodera rostochiensis TaxID=31243 RepID=A0A914H456_GLORO